MQKVELKIRALSYSNKQSGAYALILSEKNGSRDIPVIIGQHEAQAIAIALEKTVNPPRPLTHDLFKNFAQSFHIKLHEVVIHDIRDGVFFASLICTQNAKELSIDSRPSDAVALAIRFDCPIYTTEEVLNKAGLNEQDEGAPELIEEEESMEANKPQSHNTLEDATMDELNDMMRKAVQSENYELAARVRDEIEKRAR
ncbi:MAG: bifunctional nuclease family protein [Schleiferiaceae bacterium]|jgi:bifunctional DNase/RNase|nr:bifunctional nuclease family protein [Schleiferiaceae bacterium]